MLDLDPYRKNMIMHDFIHQSLHLWPNGTLRSYESKGKYGLGRPVSELTMLRLAFHDCLTYKDGSGGCDGKYRIAKKTDIKKNLYFIMNRIF